MTTTSARRVDVRSKSGRLAASDKAGAIWPLFCYESGEFRATGSNRWGPLPLLKNSVRDAWGLAALGLALACAGGAPLALGAVHPPALVAFTGGALLALGLHLFDRYRQKRRVATSLVALPFLGGALFALLHVLPLPEAVRAVLAPEATALLAYVREALPAEHQTAVRGVLTLDAAATAQSILRLVGGLAILIVIADRCRERKARRLSFRVLLGFGMALFCVSVAHRLVNADAIYGVWQPNGKLPLYGPLINPNHLARAFGVFAILLIGRGLQVRSRTEAALFILTGACCGAGVFATISRGGIASFCVALLVGLALYLWAKREATSQERNRQVEESGKLVPLILVLLVAAILLVVGTLIWDRLAFEAGREISVEGTKLQLIPVGLRLLDEHWRVGVGSGAFAFGVPLVIQAGDFGRELTVVFAENIIVETLTTHGVVVGTLLFSLAAMVFVALLKNVRVENAFPIAAIVFLFVGELFDFAFEVSFGALLAGLTLGLAVGPSLDDTGRKLAVRKVAVPSAIIAAISIWLSVIAIGDDNRIHEQEILAAKGQARETLLYDGMANHPFNSWYAYALSVTMREKRDPRGALKWANVALNLRPTLGGAHLEAARVFWALGKREQAAMEYRLAWENAQGRIVVDEVVQRTNDFDLWAKMVPTNRPDALSELCERLARQKSDDSVEGKARLLVKARECFERAGRVEGVSKRVQRRSLELAMATGDAESARRQLAQMQDIPAAKRAEYVVRLTAMTDGVDAARKKARAYADELKDPAPVLRWLLEDARRSQNHALVHGTVAQLRHHTTNKEEREALDLIEIDAWMAEGETTRGMRMLSKLVRRHPRRVPLLVRLAQTQQSLGLIAQARATAKKALRIDPRNRDAMRLLEALSANIRQPTDGGRR